MGQTVTKSGTGDALIQIQCTSDQSAAATTTSAADSHYPSTVSATSYTSTTSASSQSITSVMSASASYNTGNTSWITLFTKNLGTKVKK